MKKETTKYPNKGMNSLAKKNPKVAKKIMGYKDGGKVMKKKCAQLTGWGKARRGN
jgi:hypothetical protein